MSKALDAIQAQLEDGLIDKVKDLVSAASPADSKLVEDNFKNAQNIIDDTVKYLEAKAAEVPRPTPTI